MDKQRTGPLEDLTIIDCTMAFAGPFGTTLLADLGANVIKIEPPHGDQFRPIPPYPPDYAHAGASDRSGALSVAAVGGARPLGAPAPLRRTALASQ